MSAQDGTKLKFAQLYVDLDLKNEAQDNKMGQLAREQCTSEKIKQAFHKIALVSHPDKSRTAESTSIFMAAKQAHDVLVNDESRKKYNEELLLGNSGSFRPTFLKFKPFLNVAFQYVSAMYHKEEEKIKQQQADSKSLITRVNVAITLEDLLKSSIDKELIITDETYCDKCAILSDNACSSCLGTKRAIIKTPITIQLRPEFGCLDRNFNVRVFSDKNRILQINWTLANHGWFLHAFTEKSSQVNGIRPCDLVYIWKLSVHDLVKDQAVLTNVQMLDGTLTRLYISSSKRVHPRQVWVGRGQGLLLTVSQGRNRQTKDPQLVRGNLIVLIDIVSEETKKPILAPSPKATLVLEPMEPSQAKMIRIENDSLFTDPQVASQV